jgi:hypothetical protein
LTPGGPTVPDFVFDFTGADIETPPAGVEAITEESLGNLRTYRVEIEGIQLPLGSVPKIQATARARATERVVPARLSAFSPEVRTTVASPILPPAPFVPAAMWWASIPDPRGVARTRLQWSATAPLYAVYLADETALRRELDQPSADLEIAAADRLPALRALDFSQARRAFRRVADRVAANSLEIELPRGSKLIHFYGVIPINAAGVEGTLPVSGNAYFAVAAPLIRIPEIPILIARDRGGVVSLLVEVSEFRVQAERIEIYRAPSRHRAVATEHAGPPVLISDESTGVRSGGSIRWTLEDSDPGAAWQSVFYRAVAYGKSELIRGEYGGVSPSSPAIEVVPGSPLPPPLSDLQIEDVATEPNHRLVSFDTRVTLARTPYGLHVFAVQTIGQDATVVTRRTAADSLPLIGTTLPTPAEQPDSIFRFDSVNPRSGRTYAWVPKHIRAVVVEITDPAGRTTRETLEAS